MPHDDLCGLACVGCASARADTSRTVDTTASEWREKGEA